MFIFIVKKSLGEVVGCWSSFTDAESQLKSLKGGEIEKIRLNSVKKTEQIKQDNGKVINDILGGKWFH
jgi:hypothetical protein